ncbi:MAG: C25 family cysteine peptidase [Bacteroidota bacterium]|nr:C25 family cysteine peptidase [Bacteroidota bacterium]
MKRILLLLLIVSTLGAKAQVYNNEWIDYSKTYYKFKIGVTGLYRITQPVLASIGLGTTPAENFQLWRNGKEIPIYTTVQTGAMGNSDYFEFWGEMNDGKPDNVLYRLPDYQLSDKWSLQTDTAAFFLTVNPSGNNFRLQPTVNDVAGNSLPPEPYFMYTAGTYYKSKVNSGRSELVGDSYTYSSSYDYGEGWTSVDIANGGTLSASYGSLFPYTGSGAPAPVIKVNAAGNAVHPRYFKVNLNGDSVLGQTLNYYDYAKASAPFNISLINSGSANLDIINMGTEASDRMVVASSEITYPRQFNFAGAVNFYFELPANPAGNYLEITSFAFSGSSPILYDLTNGKRYVGDISNPAIVKIALQPSAVDRKLVLVTATGAYINYVTSPSFQARNFVNYGLPANQGNYLIISNPVLTNGANGTNPIDDYRAYRSSPEGGNYNSKIYMIDQLVDQFGLGIKMNPLSIRNFLMWARANYSEPLKDILLIGKGVVYNQFDQLDNDPNMATLALVPTYGYPASDNMLSAAPGTSTPLTPVGRVSAITANEVAIYLEKVKEYEQVQKASSPVAEDRSWMKEVIHVVGASDQQTADILSTSLDGHARIIEDTLYGGYVNKFAKNSASYVEQADNDRLTSLINGGIGILTYFGHSSSSTLEFNLDNPLNYSNAGKYPVFIVMGCNAGNFYNFNLARLTAYETLSEKYVLAPERGSIAFLASTHLGIVHYLDIYNTQTYTAASITKYGQTLGEIQDEAISKVFSITTENDFYARFQCEQFTLHGDPALRLYNFSKPDYVIEDPMVKVSPSFISIAETHFQVNAKFMNIGRATSDSVVVEVKRTYPNLTTSIVERIKIRGIRFMDSITVNIPIVATRDKGLNKITITLDPDNTIPELYETNNSVTKDVFIFEDEARPVYPYNFSIVSQQNIKLVASSANAFAVSRDYIMEIDTTELFNSPSKVTRTVTSSGGVFDFTPGITFADSTVYYWRISPSAPTGSLVWNKSSFIYLAGSDAGFNQSHLYQHFKDQFDRLKLDSVSRRFYFGDRTRNIFVRSGSFPYGFSQAAGFSVSIDGSSNIQSVCGVANVVFNVFDSISLRPWFNNWGGYPPQYGSDPICADDRAWNFQFNIQDSVKRRKAVEFMDLIPDGDYVVVRNCSYYTDAIPALANTYVTEWQNDQVNLGPGNSLYHRLKAQGFATIDSFYRPRAFIFVYRKNNNSFTPQFTFSQGIYDAITLSVDLQTPDTLGFMTSPLLGPAKGWKQLHWRGNSIDTAAGDMPLVNVYGVDNNGVETPLITNLSTAQQDYDISSIDAAQYPYIKLKMQNQDSVNLTPYQLKYWRLTYIPVPEGAIAPNLYFTTKDTVEVGEPVNFGIGFKNISNVDFDSVKVKMSITDKSNIEHIIPIPRQKKLLTTAPDDTLKLNVPIDTHTLAGMNSLFVDFNPDNDQPEQYLFNNFAYRSLYVRPDSLHPVLDVTFDGVHILNRDIVSSKPGIVVKLKDEAKWLILDDTSLLNVQVRFPDGSLHRYSFSNTDTLQFIPAGQAPNPDNTATVNFKPYFLQDGDYELIVTGKDKSDNNAGNIEYRVAFQVINKPMISNMLNYPNPFTTSTAFVFTITGTEVPQNIRIQILTITGKIVRDITKDELGPLHIGRNITEFKWDGTDQYGQKLANGIYLYRVITNLNGKSLDKYKAEGDNTDKYFNKGYGKMYLMR